MPQIQQLQSTLQQIDGAGYKAYKRIEDTFRFPDGLLAVDHVQGDPFAAPSKVRVRIDQKTAALPESWFASRARRIALEDYLARRVRDAIRAGTGQSRGSGKSGEIGIDAGEQAVVERTAVRLTPDWVEARLQVGLPAQGRKVLGRQASSLLCEEVPAIARKALCRESLDDADLEAFLECVENQAHLRSQLRDRGLVAFVADGAILPRESGVSDRPMSRREAVPFATPDSLATTLETPNPLPGGDHEIRGMGIPEGVTLIVGGGYHGKSTLLRALELAVYPHVPGDGRHYVVTDPDAVKIRAEDRRRIHRCDISPFIGELPGGRTTEAFDTDEASGSTSQAAGIVEAVEAGARALLIDEDTSATNFMVRDARMQALVAAGEEPITPFVDRARELFDQFGVSTILVMGGCGDYLDVADTVIRLHDYRCRDATDAARAVTAEHPTERAPEGTAPWQRVTPRAPDPGSIDPHQRKGKVKIDAPEPDEIRFGEQLINLRSIEQLAGRSQARAIGHALWTAAERVMNGRDTLATVLDELERILDAEGPDALDPRRRGESHPGNFVRPRRHEVAAAINRLRSLRARQIPPDK